jgi:hypothetical protein
MIGIVFSADDINMLDENTNTWRKYTYTVLEANREVGLEVNTEEPKYMVVLPPECRTKS